MTQVPCIKPPTRQPHVQLVAPWKLGEAIDRVARLVRGQYLDQQIVLVPVLVGAMQFCTALAEKLGQVEIAPAWTSAYHGGTQGSVVEVKQIPTEGMIRHKHVLIVDDILDRGLTIEAVRKLLIVMNPHSLRTAVLLRKPAVNPNRVSADFVGLDIPDKFVVGFGLDFEGFYRNLPGIWELE